MTTEKKTYYLIYVFFIVFFIAISYVAYHNYASQKLSYANQFNESQILIVEQISNGIQEFINTQKRELEIFSNNLSLHEGSDLEKIRDLLSFYRLKQKEISSIRIYNKSGTLLFALPSRVYTEKINKSFASSDFFTSVRDHTNKYKKNMYTSQVHVDDMGERVITVSAPMYDSRSDPGKTFHPEDFTGAVAVTIKLARVEQLFIESLKFHPNTYLWALDNRGEIIIHSMSPELVGMKSENAFRSKSYGKLYETSLSMIAQESGGGGYRYKNEDFYVAYTPVIVGWQNFW